MRQRSVASGFMRTKRDWYAHREDLGQQGAGEEGGVLNDHEVTCTQN
jgi:hypothetical protein